MKPVQLVVEGSLDEAVARRVVTHFEVPIERVLVKRGRSKIASKARDYHRASRISPWIILADLDTDCASDLLESWGVPASDDQFLCRFATREVESWLLSDREGAARNLVVSTAVIPPDPDALTDAKAALVNLARRSRSPRVRADLVPSPNSLLTEGPGYNLRLSAFAREQWDVARAARSSRSLARFVTALGALRGRI